MAGIPFHPAPGLGDMMPGWWTVPQNTVTARQGITKVPGIGEIIDGYYVVPQNPIKDFVTNNVKPLATGPGPAGLNAPPSSGVSGLGCGGGCGCGGMCGGHGGLGDITTDLSNIVSDIGSGNFSQAGTDFLTLLQEPTLAGIPLWAFGIGLYFLIQMVSSHEVSFGQKASSGGTSYRKKR